MQTQNMIVAAEFCQHQQIEFSFIQALHDSGLIEIFIEEENWLIPEDQLRQLEKFSQLYYEMDINLAGIETIHHLLQQIDNMQQEVVSLKNRLKMYEKKQNAHT